MFEKRGQAAMEFLMTYGWAILVVLVAIGALAYFGVLSPDKFLPERCTGPAGMDCLDKASVSATAGTLEIVAKNNLGFDINISDQSGGYAPSIESNDFGNIQELASLGGCEGSDGDFGLAVGNPPGQPSDILANGTKVPSGDSFKIRMCSTTGISEGRFKADVSIQYINLETNLQHPATYSVTGIAS